MVSGNVTGWWLEVGVQKGRISVDLLFYGAGHLNGLLI